MQLSENIVIFQRLGLANTISMTSLGFHGQCHKVIKMQIELTHYVSLFEIHRHWHYSN